MKTTNHLSFESAGKEMPFSVPEGYFDQFAAQIDTQIGYKSGGSGRFLRPWMYMAAAVLVGIVILTPVLYTKNQRTVAQNSDNYESYVLSQVDETVMLDCYVDDSSTKK